MSDQDDKVQWVQVLEPDAAQRRETFARFGLAMYQAQCVEKQLSILLATTFNHGFLNLPQEHRDSCFDSELSKTLGRLISTLREKMEVPPGIDGRLHRALHLRNWLAHNYFWERAGDIMNRNGRDHMIRELQETADFLSEVDHELTSISKCWLEKCGASWEMIEAETNKYRSAGDA